MTDKFQMRLDLDEYEAELVHEALERAALLPSKSVKKDTINNIKARIQLAWAEYKGWPVQAP